MSAIDAELVAKYRGGDTKAFDELYMRYQVPLYNYIYRISGSASMAEDIFQEVFFQVIQKMHTYSENQNFKAWIYTVARNRVIDRGRLKSSNDVVLGDSWEGSSSMRPPSEIAETNEQAALVRGTIDGMPEAIKEILLLRHYSGLSFKEIAAMTGIPLGTVLSRVHRGLESLREQLA